MSFIGNFAAARAYKATAAYNRELYMMQSRLQKAKTNQAKAVYDRIDRPRLLKKQDSDYDFLFVRALKSGAEIREGESPYLALLEAGVNQATDLAIADFNSRQAYYDGINQSLLTAFKGEGEMFKGRVLAQSEMIKGTCNCRRQLRINWITIRIKMAVLKIPQSELRANVGQATPVSEAALPMSLAKAYGQAIGEVGKQVQKVAKDQRDINDQITLNEMVRDAIVKMEKG